MMNRREFVNGLTFALLAAPLTADAQKEAKVARIGLLGSSSRGSSQEPLKAFWQGLRLRDLYRRSAAFVVTGQGRVVHVQGERSRRHRDRLGA